MRGPHGGAGRQEREARGAAALVDARGAWEAEARRARGAWAAGEKARREAWAAGKAREVKELTIKARAGGPGARAGCRVRVAYAVDAWATLVRRARGRSPSDPQHAHEILSSPDPLWRGCGYNQLPQHTRASLCALTPNCCALCPAVNPSVI